MYEPPVEADDTPSHFPRVTESTLPRRKKPQPILPGWALLALILFTGVSLFGSLMLLFSRTDDKPIETESMSITLMLGSERRDLESSAATVGELLASENIALAADDALSPASETTLSDGMVITIAHARMVRLIVDGLESSLSTPFDNPAAILEQAGIVLDELDELWIDGTAASLLEAQNWPVPANEITVRHAFTITILDGTEQRIVRSTGATVGDVLYEAGVDIYFTDIVNPESNSAISGDTTISINRARPITIRVDGAELQSRVQGGTVADALSEAGIALIGLDYSIPAESDPIAADMTIHVVRVTESIESTDESIPFETTYQADANLELDQQQVIQAGVNGLQRYNERVRYEDGLEVWREPAGTEMVQVPQNAIVAYGTNIVIRTIDTPEGPREYWRQLRVYATSYKPEDVGGNTTTAIGETLRHGIIGANPTIIPYRTNVYVPNYGTGMIADTGGPRSSPYWIDLGYTDEDYRSWHQYVDIYLLTPVPANINYLLPAWRPMAGLPDN